MSFPTIVSLAGRHTGQDIFVIGTSDSLNELDLSLLKGQVMIGTNDALGAFETRDLGFVPRYLLTTELSATDRALVDLVDHPEVTLFTRERIAQVAKESGFDGKIYVYEVGSNPRLRMEGPLHNANNTAHYAVEIAARMQLPGKRIMLVGVDLRYPTKEELEQGKQNHYWGDGAVDGCRPAFATAIEQFPLTARQLSLRGFQLITVSPWDGPLTACLPRMELEEVVRG